MALLQRPEEVLERLAEVDAPLKPTTETSPQAHQLALLKAHPLIGYGNRALYATITYATKVLRS